MFSTWIGVVLLFAFFGLLALVVIGASPRGDTYEQKRAKVRAEKLQGLREETTKALATYAWVDKGKGVVRIPIHDAMKLTAAELSKKTPAPANPIATPAGSPAAQASAASPAAPGAAPSAAASGSPKTGATSVPSPENRNPPPAANSKPAAAGAQPGASTAPASGVSSTSPAAKTSASPSVSPSSSPSLAPSPVRGKTP